MISLDLTLKSSIDLMKENSLTKKARNWRYAAETITDVDNADDLVLLQIYQYKPNVWA